MDRALLDSSLSQLPIFQYEYIKTSELTFSDNARYICETECPMYGKTWACPPAVGSVDSCTKKCLSYDDAIIVTTVSEVGDITNMEETLSTRAGHEEVIAQVKDLVSMQHPDTFVLSTEACAICETCTYPDAPCRYPDKMFPCVESHGILVTDIAEKYDISFYNGSNIVTWFSVIFYR